MNALLAPVAFNLRAQQPTAMQAATQTEAVAHVAGAGRE
jgi:hypothetical protein